MTRLKSPLEQAYEAIEYYFTTELCDSGLLWDVNTFLTAATTNEHIDAPVVWFEKETVIPVNQTTFSEWASFNIPFSLVCGTEITDDFITAEQDSLNLACRCLTSLYKNILKPRQGIGEHVKVNGFTVDKIDPNGTFEIINKTTLLPATRVSLTFNVTVNMMLYLEGDVIRDFGENELQDYDIIFDETTF